MASCGNDDKDEGSKGSGSFTSMTLDDFLPPDYKQ